MAENYHISYMPHIILIFHAFNSQITLFFNEVMTWAISTSSLLTQGLYSFIQTCIFQFTSGVSTATPRPISIARAQAVRFYRTMAEPTICRIRDRLGKYFRPATRKGLSKTRECESLNIKKD